MFHKSTASPPSLAALHSDNFPHRLEGMEIQRHPLFPTALMFSELIQKHADADIPGEDKDAEYVTNLLPMSQRYLH